MKVIIAGSRNITHHTWVKACIDKYHKENPITEVVCGLAHGADTYGKEWAEENNIPVKCFPADWECFGKQAGFIRNEEMGKYADKLLAFWNGSSRGTRHMINFMDKLNKPVFIYYY